MTYQQLVLKCPHCREDHTMQAVEQHGTTYYKCDTCGELCRPPYPVYKCDACGEIDRVECTCVNCGLCTGVDHHIRNSCHCNCYSQGCEFAHEHNSVKCRECGRVSNIEDCPGADDRFCPGCGAAI